MRRLTAAVLMISLLGTSAWAGPMPWTPGTYRGLVTGKARKADVRRVLGRPKWVGHPENPDDAPVRSVLAYAYAPQGTSWGWIRVWMDAKTGIVIEVVLEARDDVSVPIAQALEEAGIVEKKRQGVSDLDYSYRSSDGYLIYPRLGLSLTVTKDKQVHAAVLSAKRP